MPLAWTYSCFPRVGSSMQFGGVVLLVRLKKRIGWKMNSTKIARIPKTHPSNIMKQEISPCITDILYEAASQLLRHRNYSISSASPIAPACSSAGQSSSTDSRYHSRYRITWHCYTSISKFCRYEREFELEFNEKLLQCTLVVKSSTL